VQKNESNFQLKGFVVFRHDLSAWSHELSFSAMNWQALPTAAWCCLGKWSINKYFYKNKVGMNR